MQKDLDHRLVAGRALLLGVGLLVVLGTCAGMAGGLGADGNASSGGNGSVTVFVIDASEEDLRGWVEVPSLGWGQAPFLESAERKEGDCTYSAYSANFRAGDFTDARVYVKLDLGQGKVSGSVEGEISYPRVTSREPFYRGGAQWVVGSFGSGLLEIYCSGTFSGALPGLELVAGKANNPPSRYSYEFNGSIPVNLVLTVEAKVSQSCRVGDPNNYKVVFGNYTVTETKTIKVGAIIKGSVNMYQTSQSSSIQGWVSISSPFTDRLCSVSIQANGNITTAERGKGFTVEGPGMVKQADQTAVFRTTGSGVSPWPPTSVEWRFSYSDRYGNWVDLGTITRSDLKDLVIGHEGQAGGAAETDLEAWFQLATVHGKRGAEGSRELQMKVKAVARGASSQVLATSNEHKFTVRVEGYSFTLEHYGPFFGMAEAYGPAVLRAIQESWRGDVQAKLTDYRGQGVPGSWVYFYVEPDESSSLHNVTNAFSPPAEWILIATALGLSTEIENQTYLGSAVTSTAGEAVFNYIEMNSFNAERIAAELLKAGKVEGTIRAVVVDKADLDSRLVPRIEYNASAHVVFDCIAQIVGITGKGWPDSFKQEYLKLNPEDTWGPGRVRVKRILAKPTFDYTPAEVGFKIMPGDILDIDGNVEVAITWVTGDIAVVRVPDKHQFKGSQNLVEHVRLPVLRNAYESGFATGYEEAASTLLGFGIDKAISALISTIPGSDQVSFCVDLLNAFKKEVDLSQIEEFARVRVRSTILIDTTGEEVRICAVEGSPEVRTITGGQITISDMEKVTVTLNGSLGAREFLIIGDDLEGWTEYLEAGGEGAVPVAAMLAAAGILLRKRKRGIREAVLK